MMIQIAQGIAAYVGACVIMYVVVFGPLIYFAPELPWHD